MNERKKFPIYMVFRSCKKSEGPGHPFMRPSRVIWMSDDNENEKVHWRKKLENYVKNEFRNKQSKFILFSLHIVNSAREAYTMEEPIIETENCIEKNYDISTINCLVVFY